MRRKTTVIVLLLLIWWQLALPSSTVRGQTRLLPPSRSMTQRLKQSHPQIGKSRLGARGPRFARRTNPSTRSFTTGIHEEILAGQPNEEPLGKPDTSSLPEMSGLPQALALEDESVFDMKPAGPCDSCGGTACDLGGRCCLVPLPCGRLWFRGEYLQWWTRGANLPPLVTTSPNGTPQPVAGVLGFPTTSVAFGATDANESGRSGGAFAFGYTWANGVRGIEGRYLGLSTESTDFQAASNGNPVLARPFFNIETGVNDALLIAFTGQLNGSVMARAYTEFDAAEVLLRWSFCSGCQGGLDFLLGYRYSRLDDGLVISQSIVDIGGAAPGSTTALFDQFDSESRFHGVEFGFAWHRRWLCWSLELDSKLALGNTNSEVVIDGQTTTTDALGATVVNPEGFLAQSTNIGRVEQDDFAVIPELGATLLYDITCRLRATFGYRFVYWSQVARAADQIDLDLNLSDPLVGGRRPLFEFTTTDFWAQGLHVGLDYRY